VLAALSFGIIYAIRNIGRVKGLVIGLDAILEL
jgi:hypothetical protein